MAGSERTDQADKAGATTASEAAATAGAASATAASGSFSGSREQAGAVTSEYPSGPATAASPLDAARISCLTNAQYHSGREAFLDTVHRWFMFTVIALGAGALIDLLPKEHIVPGTALSIGLKELFAASAAIIAALDLTFDLSNRARQHAMQKRRYFELLGQLNAGEKTPEQVRVCIDQFSADEEPPYRVMIFACWNAAQLTVYGNDAHRIHIPLIAGWFKNWFRRPSAHYDLETS
jgi:hypothetical protein